MSSNPPIVYEVVVEESERVTAAYSRLERGAGAISRIFENQAAVSRATSERVLSDLKRQEEALQAQLNRKIQVDNAEQASFDARSKKMLAAEQQLARDAIRATEERGRATVRVAAQELAAQNSLYSRMEAQLRNADQKHQNSIAIRKQAYKTEEAAIEALIVTEDRLNQALASKEPIATINALRRQIVALNGDLKSAETAYRNAVNAEANARSGLGTARGNLNAAGTSRADAQQTLEAARRNSALIVDIERRTQADRMNVIREFEAYKRDAMMRGNEAEVAEMQKVIDAVKAQAAAQTEAAAQMEQRAKDVAMAWQDVGRGIYQMGAQIRNVGLAISGALTAPITLAAKSAFEFNNLRDQAGRAFGIMIHDGPRAQAFVEGLYEQARVTPFEFDNITRSAQKLLAAGYNLQQIPRILNTIGNAATLSAGGGDAAGKLDQITDAFTRMQARHKLMAGELKTLVAAGVPAYDILGEAIAKATGKQKDQIDVFSLAKNRMIDADFAISVLSKGIEERFGGAMESMQHTVPGAMSMLRDTFRSAVGDMIKPFQDQLPNAINKLTESIANLHKQFMALSPAQRTAIVETIAAVAAIGPLLVSLGVLAGAVGHVVTGIGAFKLALVKMFGGAVAEGTTFGGTLLGIGKAIAGILPEILIVTIALAALGIAIYNSFTRISEAWDTAVSDLGGIWRSKGAPIMGAISSAWNATIEFIKSVWSATVAFFQGGIDAVSQFFAENWDAIKDATSNALTFVVAYFQAVVPPIIAILSGLFGLIMGIVGPIWEAIKLTWRETWDVAAGVLSIFVNLFAGRFDEALLAFNRMLGRMARDFVDFFKNAWAWARDGVLNITNGIQKWVYDFLTAIGDSSEQSFSQIMTRIQEVIVGKVLAIVNQFRNFGVRSAAAFWSGFQSGGNEQRYTDVGHGDFGITGIFNTLTDYAKEKGAQIGDVFRKSMNTGGDDEFGGGGGGGGGKAAKSPKADPMLKMLEDLNSKVESLRGNFRALNENELNKFSEIMQAASMSFEEGKMADFRAIIKYGGDQIRHIADEAEGTIVDKLFKVSAEAGARAEEIIRKFGSDPRVDDALKASVEIAYRQQADILRKAAEASAEATKRIGDINAQALSFVDKVAGQERQRLDDLAKFSVWAKAHLLEWQKAINDFMAAQDALAGAQEQERWRKMLTDIDKLRLDAIENESTKRKALFDYEQNEYERSAKIDLGYASATGEEKKAIDAALEARRNLAQLKYWDAERKYQNGLANDAREMQIMQIRDIRQRTQAERELAATKKAQAIDSKFTGAGTGSAAAQAAYDAELLRQKLSAIDQIATQIESLQGVPKAFLNPRVQDLAAADAKMMEELGLSVGDVDAYFSSASKSVDQFHKRLLAVAQARTHFRALQTTTVQGLKDVVKNTLFTAEAFSRLGVAIGNALLGIIQGTESFGSAMKKLTFGMIGDLASAFGDFYIAKGIAYVADYEFARGFKVIAAGVALKALGAIMSGLGQGGSQATGGGSAAAASPGAGDTGGRERPPTRSPFETSGENTVVVRWEGTRGNKVVNALMEEMIDNGVMTTKSIKNKHRKEYKRGR